MIDTISDRFTRPLSGPDCIVAGEFVEVMLSIVGLGYHSDTRGDSYVWDGTGERVFSDRAAREIDGITARFEEEGLDLCGIALDIIHGPICHACQRKLRKGQGLDFPQVDGTTTYFHRRCYQRKSK